MLAGALLLTIVALHLAAGVGESVGQLHWYLQEAVQASQAPSQASTSAALWRFKSFSCTTRKDGVYPELASSCSYYYRCLDGAVFSYVCPPGQAFHYPSEECRPAGEVSCPHVPPASPPCINQSDGYYPDYRQDCKSYYRCTNGTLNGRWQCEGDAVWDSSTGSCGTGPLLVCSPPSCWGLPDGPHPAPASSCTSYFTCSGGVRTDHVCPYNSIFDYSLKRCVAGKSSVCYEQACEGRLNGLHAVPHAPCNSFFRCFNGDLVKLEECPKHQIFDGRRCVPERNFSCWQEGRGSCEDEEDGFHVAPDSGCRGFFLCHQQQFIRAYKCLPGLMFNGKDCIDDRNYICNARSRLPDCSTKIDGYYTMEKSECRTFFYCRGGSKMSEHTCPGNNVFNGEQCVDTSLFRCPVREESEHPRNFTNNVVRARRSIGLDCHSRDDGFYLYERSGCRRFFRCHNGRKDSVGTCPYQQVFNGLRCVTEENYRCPVTPDADDCKLREDGDYQDTTDNCSSFFQCLNGVKIQSQCLEGELHDGRICRAASEVFCPSATLCDSRSDGDFVDTDRGCRGYFSCRNGTLVRYASCGQGELHNGKECVPGFFYSCPARVGPTTCLGEPDGIYADASTQCRQCYQCSSGRRVTSVVCPPEEILRCRGSAHVLSAAPDTQGAITSASHIPFPDEDQEDALATEPLRRKPPSPVPVSRENPKDTPPLRETERALASKSLIPLESEKLKDTHQALGRRAQDEMKTPHFTLHLLHSKETAAWKSLVPVAVKNHEGISALHHSGRKAQDGLVSHRPNGDCSEMDGHYSDLSTGCRTFYSCKSGRRIEHKCPAEQVFNGVQCVPANQYSCPGAMSCQGRANGFYRDLSSSCRKFFYCHDGFRYGLTCPSHHVFDGQNCVPSHSYTCPDLLKDRDCVNRESGFYAEVSSMCQRYYSCKDGIKVQSFTCLKDQIFDGKNCVPAETSFCDFSEALATSRHVPAAKEIGELKSLVPSASDSNSLYRAARPTQTEAVNECAGLPNGTYTAVDSQCQRFLQCNEQARWFQCPFSFMYSPVSNTCEPSIIFACPTHNPCQFLDDGVHGDSENNCRVFFTCRGKKLQLVSVCPEGQAFSQSYGRCQEERESSCQVAAA